MSKGTEMTEVNERDGMNGMDWIRGVLFESIEAMRRGDEKAGVAQSKANACGKIILSYKIELEYMHMRGRRPSPDMFNFRNPDELIEDKSGEETGEARDGKASA